MQELHTVLAKSCLVSDGVELYWLPKTGDVVGGLLLMGLEVDLLVGLVVDFVVVLAGFVPGGGTGGGPPYSQDSWTREDCSVRVVYLSPEY